MIGQEGGMWETGRFLEMCGHIDASLICCWKLATCWE